MIQYVTQFIVIYPLSLAHLAKLFLTHLKI